MITEMITRLKPGSAVQLLIHARSEIRQTLKYHAAATTTATAPGGIFGPRPIQEDR